MNRDEHNPNTLYQRLENGKYVPVAEYETFDYWRQGDYLVSVKPGSTSIKKILFTERAMAEVTCVLNRIIDKICTAIVTKQDEPDTKHLPKKLTKKQLKAFEDWKAAFKVDRVYLNSIQDCVQKAFDQVKQEIIDKRNEQAYKDRLKHYNQSYYNEQ